MCKYKRQIKQQAQNNSTVNRIIVMFVNNKPTHKTQLTYNSMVYRNEDTIFNWVEG